MNFNLSLMIKVQRFIISDLLELWEITKGWDGWLHAVVAHRRSSSDTTHLEKGSSREILPTELGVAAPKRQPATVSRTTICHRSIKVH